MKDKKTTIKLRGWEQYIIDRVKADFIKSGAKLSNQDVIMMLMDIGYTMAYLSRNHNGAKEKIEIEKVLRKKDQ